MDKYKRISVGRRNSEEVCELVVFLTPPSLTGLGERFSEGGTEGEVKKRTSRRTDAEECDSQRSSEVGAGGEEDWDEEEGDEGGEGGAEREAETVDCESATPSLRPTPRVLSAAQQTHPVVHLRLSTSLRTMSPLSTSNAAHLEAPAAEELVEQHCDENRQRHQHLLHQAREAQTHQTAPSKQSASIPTLPPRHLQTILEHLVKGVAMVDAGTACTWASYQVKVAHCRHSSKEVSASSQDETEEEGNDEERAEMFVAVVVAESRPAQRCESVEGEEEGRGEREGEEEEQESAGQRWKHRRQGVQEAERDE